MSVIRPLAHLTAPKNWINDPNGFIWFDGQYHLYYQHFPYAPRWGRMHWGHATGKDLATWEHHDIVLFPTKLYDRDGCFSGSAIAEDGGITFYYTGVRYVEHDPENVNRMTNDTYFGCQVRIASPDGFAFDNFGGKTEIIPPITDETLGSCYHTRDPKVWRDGEWMYMILGSQIQQPGLDKKTPKVLFYRSRDGKEWEYLNAFASHDTLGQMWECPDIFEVDGQWILCMSPMKMWDVPHEHTAQAVYAQVGFTPATGELDWDGKTWRLVDYGLDYYAPQSTLDREGRRVQVGWLRMEDPFEGEPWTGVFCFPRLIEVKDGEIYTTVHPEIMAHFAPAAEVDAEKPYGIKTCLAEGEALYIGEYRIAMENGCVTADRTGLTPNSKAQLISRTPAVEGSAELEIYIDHCVAEIYVNGGRYVISHVVDPKALKGELKLPADAQLLGWKA